VRKGGRVCLYGGAPRGTSFMLDTYRVHYEEITVSGIFHHTPKIFKTAVEWLSQGKIRTKEFISEKRTLADVVPILSGQDKAGPLKFVIRP
jgi:L-iditol 2-dehydrogenase